MDGHLTDERSRRALESLELFADGLITEADFTIARTQAWESHNDWSDDLYGTGLSEYAVNSVSAVLNPNIHAACSRVIWFVQNGFKQNAPVGNILVTKEQTRRRICAVIHEIIGNPFQKWSRTPPWYEGGLIQPDGTTVALTDTVRGLAETIHKLQAFERLPILADALEEAGITDTALLAHCRSEDKHLRGCWALDVVRGKS